MIIALSEHTSVEYVICNLLVELFENAAMVPTLNDEVYFFLWMLECVNIVLFP